MEEYDGLSRFDFDAYVSSQDLAEYYLPPFRSCTRDAKSWFCHVRLEQC
jgi:beta-D-xylosidase 4